MPSDKNADSQGQLMTPEESLANLSLMALREESEQAWENFIALGVLAENVSVAAPVAVTLWGMQSEKEASERLEFLWNQGLLLSDSPVEVGGCEWKSYRMHDLLRDVARRQLIAARPLGMGFSSLQEAHAQLLERYRLHTRNSLWHTLPEDGYIHEHLVWHLEKAGQVEEIHRLLREEAESGRNGWYEARERLAQTGGYLGNVTRAWELAEANPTEATLPEVVGSECRYALIVASVNSLPATMPVNLLVALVKKKVWAPAQGLAYALQIPDPEQKAGLAQLRDRKSVV